MGRQPKNVVVRDPDDVVVPEQRQVEVFANQAGGVSVRHPPDWPHDEDGQLVMVPMTYVPAVIAKLQRILAEHTEEHASDSVVPLR